MKFFAKSVLVLVGGLAAIITVAWWYFLPPSPDLFYDYALGPDTAPGTLLKQEAFTRNLPPDTAGWRILYQTTKSDGSPALASAIVVVPISAAKPSPLVAWAHGTTGVAPGCAPSLLENAFPHIPAFPALFKEGWAYVGTDYAGQGTGGGHAYLVGDDAARNVLDSIRAARQVKGISLDPRTVVWGHSQGGHSALWSGLRAQDYAPEIDIRGIAALAPASDLVGLMEAAKASSFGKLVTAFALDSYARSYADVPLADQTDPRSRLLLADIVRRCVGGWETLFSLGVAALAPEHGLLRNGVMTPQLQARLRENTPRGRIPVTVFIGQGLGDDLVLPEIQNNYAKELCATGQALDYRLYDGRDHLSLVAPDSPLTADLLAWSNARLAGDAFSSNCR